MILIKEYIFAVNIWSIRRKLVYNYIIFFLFTVYFYLMIMYLDVILTLTDHM